MANAIFDVIKEDLACLEKALLQAVASPIPLIAEIGTHLVQSGGKRLRPALYFLAARSGPRFDRDHAMPLAVAIEVIHMASLVHDDVIDEADTRRGSATANSQWGNQMAILSGDYLFAHAFSLVAGNHYDEGIALRLAELVCGLSSGEIIQDASAYQAARSMPDYYRRIEKKTADFLALCCEMGAIISQADEAVSKALYTYGHSIGMAFQITDDLLDILADAERIGKPAGNDIRQGIVTLPVIRALDTSPYSAELMAIVTDPEMTDAMVSRALEIVRSSDGIAFAQAQADEYLRLAKQALPKGLPPEAEKAFLQAADFIGKREF